jgi:hypothetical protein
MKGGILMAPKNNKKDWTPEQEEFLLESFGVAGIQFMMDRLGRSAAAIKLKHEELTGHKNTKEAAGTFSAREVASILGVTPRTVIDWIVKNKFPSKQILKLRGDTRPADHSIDPHAMWRWVGKNRERVNFAHVKLGVAFPEPDWLAAEVARANQNLLKRPKNWTREEEESAWFWFRAGVPVKDIAKRLQRPFKGTQAKMTRIAKKKIQEKQNKVVTKE